MDRVSQCIVEWNRQQDYEISEGRDRHTVDINKCYYTCRAWDLTGIPCPHGIYTLYHSKKELQSYVHPWYSKEKYITAYTFYIQPFVGKDMWPKTNMPPILPPDVHKVPGRPKKSRRKDQ